MLIRTEMIKICYGVLNDDPKVHDLAVKVLKKLGYTSTCEDCKQPAGAGIRWCPRCAKRHVGEDHVGLGLLLPNDGDL